MPLDYNGPVGGGSWQYYGGATPRAIDGNYSHPWLYNSGSPTVQTQWLTNLQDFFTDAKNAGMAILPTLSFDPSGPYLYNPVTPVSDCAGTGSLMFYPWLPYGLEQSNRFDDGDGINTCYPAGASNSEFFWGWSPFQSLFGGLANAMYLSGVTLRELDIMQERNLYYFPIEARLIYDNSHSFDVLGYIRSTLGSYGYSGSLATFSGGASNTVLGYDCGSIYGDSAMLIFTSEITGAIAGYTYGGLFGRPNPDNINNGLTCYIAGQSDALMDALPPGHGYTQPNVVDVHAYPCNLNLSPPVGSESDCFATDATGNAQTLYSDVWAFLQYRGLTGATATFGESSIVGWNTSPGAQPTDGGTGYPPVPPCPWQPNPTWAVNGYLGSSLYANHASATILMPFNNLANGCYLNPVTLNPPY
jgi:hypothetical protein